MKNLLTIFFIVLAVSTSAQTALYNNGNLRIHAGGNLGFHTDLINNSPFDSNLGLAGFYGPQTITVSGNLTPQFYDSEIILDNDLTLVQGMNVTNNFNFIVGNVRTPLTEPEVYLNFLDASFYAGEGDLSKVIGYAAITNQQNFMFPVGDLALYRPLILDSEGTNFLAKCAYFLEDANAPVSIAQAFSTFELDLDLEFVSAMEFWRLEGTVPSTIRITWNERSNLAALTDDYTKIVPVGWSKQSRRWINLEGSTPVGDLSQGFVTSGTFVPSDYEIITFGVSKIPFEPLSKEVLNLENYFVSVNGDGINDAFFIPELEEFDSNYMQIYDRYGIKVFAMENYTDEFVGFSNLNNIPFNKEEGLPVGVYFYTINIPDAALNYQGFLYLAR